MGGLIDFGMLTATGENITDAAIKSTVHVGVGIGAGEIGAIIGTAIGGPGIGTVLGFIIGWAANQAFDYIYDHKEEIFNEVGKSMNNAGNCLRGGFFGTALQY